MTSSFPTTPDYFRRSGSGESIRAMTEETFDMAGEPEATDNSAKPEDGEQDVSQDPDADYSEESVVPPAGEE